MKVLSLAPAPRDAARIYGLTDFRKTHIAFRCGACQRRYRVLVDRRTRTLACICGGFAVMA